MLHFPVDFQEPDGRWRDAIPADFVPVLYITADDRRLCASCLNTYERQRDRRKRADPAWRVTAFDLLYEGPDAVCTQCGSVTATLFGDPDAPVRRRLTVARLGLYQPFIEDRNVRRLYQLKLEHRRRTGTKVPMTALINRILDDFFGADPVDADSNATVVRPVPSDTPPGSPP